MGVRVSESLAQLPDAGGVNDQCAWLMDAFGIIAARSAENP